MPSSLPTLDDQFPTLRGDESPREMFVAIVNYLFVMKESLDYTLANLSADNWNSTAWEEMTEDTKAPLEKLEKQLVYLAGVVSQVNNELLSQRITVGDLTENMGKTKDRVSALEDRADTLEGDADYLLEQVVKQEKSIGGLNKEMTNTKESVVTLERNVAEMQEQTQKQAEKLEELTKDGGLLEDLILRVERLEDRFVVEESGATVIGKENTPLNLVGEVSINGVPYEEGTE